MKRPLLFVTSAVSFGALAGFLVSDCTKLTAQLPPSVAALLPAAVTQGAPAKVKVASATTAFGRAINATTATVTPILTGKPLPTGGLVLNEPVVIVQGGARRHAMLPQGTAVSLVKNEGRFVSVRHDRNVLTVPRSAVAVGVTRTN